VLSPGCTPGDIDRGGEGPACGAELPWGMDRVQQKRATNEWSRSGEVSRIIAR
jgi:hypothetical protein